MAVLVLVVAVGASANRLSFSSQTFKVEWSSLGFVAEGIEVRCEVVILGSLHSATFSKTAGALVGFVTAGIGAAESCRGTSGVNPMGLDESVPWHVDYAAFTGTLPRITAVKFDVIGVSFTATILGERCLYRSTTERPARVIANVNASGVMTEARADETFLIPKSSGAFCPASARPNGTGTMSVVGAQNGMTVTLI